jgi:hypothetical protein
MSTRGASLLLGLALAAPAQAGPPPEGRCPGFHLAPDATAVDAVPRRMAPGIPLGYDHLPSLQDLLPEEVWSNRKVFFYPGMRMTIGDCHRVYPVPSFYEDATRRYSPQVKLDDEGNLEGYVAGTPFPPEGIDPAAPDAGLRWAWNLEHRFRGAGPVGHFRIVDIAGRMGGDQTYEGEFFFLQTSHRADLAASGFSEPDAGGTLWVAGGRFAEPTNARHLAWRQMRPEDVLRDYGEPDDTFVYVPSMRKMRRAASAWVDGIYMPRYRLGGDGGGGGLPIGGGAYDGPQGSVNPTAGESIQVTENLRVGFTGLALRPNGYVWRVRGEREVIAPLNVAWPGYPIVRDRNFGPHGLSIGSDRWDVRWAVDRRAPARAHRLRDADALRRLADPPAALRGDEDAPRPHPRRGHPGAPLERGHPRLPGLAERRARARLRPRRRGLLPRLRRLRLAPRVLRRPLDAGRPPHPPPLNGPGIPGARAVGFDGCARHARLVDLWGKA